MDEVKLKRIIRKHRNRAVNFFIFSSLIFLSIHYYYQNHDALEILAYSTALVVAAVAAVLSFVEKSLLEINKSLKDQSGE